MSIKISSLVWKLDGLTATQKFVLLRLADFADDDGGSVFPSVPKVATDCGLTDRAVQKAIRSLEEVGLLVLVHEAVFSKRRPREYRIAIAGEPDAPVNDVHRRTTFTPPVNQIHPTGEPDSPRSIIKPSTNRQTRERAKTEEAFDQFWKAYPSRSPHANPRKPAAAKFTAAVKGGADPAAIIEGAKRLSAHVAGKDPQFTPMASTWLSQARWQDAPPDRPPATALPSMDDLPNFFGSAP